MLKLSKKMRIWKGAVLWWFWDVSPFVSRSRFLRAIKLAREYGEAYAEMRAEEQMRPFLNAMVGFDTNPKANSDTITMFFPKYLRGIQGDESFAKFVSEQVGKTVYTMVRQAKKD